MAINFDGSTSNAYYATLATLTSSAITIAMWLQIDQVANAAYWFQILNTDGIGALYWQQFGGDPTQVLFGRQNNTYSATKSRLSSTGFVAAASTTWLHLAITDGATFNDGTQINIYQNGIEATYASTNNGSGSPRPLNDSWVLGIDNASGVDVFDGRMGEIAVWNVEQPISVIESLADGFSPLLYPHSLLLYVPGLAGSANNRRGPVPTATVGLTAADHVRQLYPAPPLLGRHQDAAVAGHPSWCRWGGTPGMRPGGQLIGRGW